METEILARIQFAFTVAFHYIYPPLSIGLGLLLVIFKESTLEQGTSSIMLSPIFGLRYLP